MRLKLERGANDAAAMTKFWMAGAIAGLNNNPTPLLRLSHAIVLRLNARDGLLIIADEPSILYVNPFCIHTLVA